MPSKNGHMGLENTNLIVKTKKVTTLRKKPRKKDKGGSERDLKIEAQKIGPRTEQVLLALQKGEQHQTLSTRNRTRVSS